MKATIKIIHIIVCILFLFLSSNCSNNHRLEISNVSLDSCYSVKLNRHNPSTFGIEILQNSLNDTAIIDNMKVPPKMIGVLYKGADFFDHTRSVCYKKYKADSGKLTITYFY